MTDLSWEGLTRKIRTSISMDATQIANLLNLGQICNIKDHSTKVLVYMLVHLALALRASVEEERASQDVAARVAEEKECGHASISHDTTMTENAGIMSDGANTCDLMDDDTALLERALVMSLKDHQSIPSGGILMGDADMSEATKEDQELALGKLLA
ncbi:26S proteasome non-ATPase regulatory subunit 4 homolog [Papaver somniferum]|uniref:26S proteasome non-ATPase regulatory subunit 4 homolog n=1 Tax=Papaver somniferum TaxID=3469 RepID=UPI000E6F49D5|nr:26S proteasome non-ATPase regulatory subunit 4 homolog [Papaver somniferum]